MLLGTTADIPGRSRAREILQCSKTMSSKKFTVLRPGPSKPCTGSHSVLPRKQQSAAGAWAEEPFTVPVWGTPKPYKSEPPKLPSFPSVNIACQWQLWCLMVRLLAPSKKNSPSSDSTLNPRPKIPNPQP